MEDPKELRILHLTDTHCDYDNVDKLRQWVKNSGEQIDLVLISGDIANIPLDQYHTASAELNKEHEEHMKIITESFLGISEKVYYIPGNHDPLSSFDRKPVPDEGGTRFPMNVHAIPTRIAPNLTLLGFGGSVPSFTPEGQQVWEGFPYDSDDKFSVDVKLLLDEVVSNDAIPPKETLLLMTHNGPSNSSTAEVHSPSNPTILGGSGVLHSYLLKDRLQNHCVLHIHGHTHDCTGMSTIGRVTVVNPGPIVYGRFGMYTLEAASDAAPSWKIRSMSFHRLDGAK